MSTNVFDRKHILEPKSPYDMSPALDWYIDEYNKYSLLAGWNKLANEKTRPVVSHAFAEIRDFLGDIILTIYAEYDFDREIMETQSPFGSFQWNRIVGIKEEEECEPTMCHSTENTGTPTCGVILPFPSWGASEQRNTP